MNNLFVYDAVITTDCMSAHPVGVVAESPLEARRTIRARYYPQKIIFFDCFRCLGHARPHVLKGVSYNYYELLDLKDC